MNDKQNIISLFKNKREIAIQENNLVTLAIIKFFINNYKELNYEDKEFFIYLFFRFEGYLNRLNKIDSSNKIFNLLLNKKELFKEEFQLIKNDFIEILNNKTFDNILNIHNNHNHYCLCFDTYNGNICLDKYEIQYYDYHNFIYMLKEDRENKKNFNF